MTSFNSELRQLDDLDLPDFFRLQWTGNEARAYWEPVIEHALQANVFFLNARFKAGCCKVGILKSKPSGSFHIQQQLLRQGHYFSVLPNYEMGGLFLNEIPCKYLSHLPSDYYVAALSKQDLQQFEEMDKLGDAVGQRYLLGLEDRNSADFNWKDPILEFLLHTFAGGRENINGNWLIDLPYDDAGLLAKQLIMNYLGLCLVWRYDIPLLAGQSRQQVHQFVAALQSEKPALSGNMMEFLSLPVELTSYHGITEVKTPVVKFITNSHGLQTKITIRISGDGRPTKYGAKGIRFPYKTRS